MSSSAGKISLGLIAALFVAVILVIGGFLRGSVLRLPGERVYGATKVALNIAPSAAPESLADFKNGFAAVIDPALPAVVNISSTKVVKQPQGNLPGLFNDPFFRQFFGDQSGPQSPTPQNEREFSLGSGVILNPDGYVVTNNHVVAGGSDIQVFTQDRRRFKATVIGTDARTDIAVLKIDASGLPCLTLDDSSKLKVGDLVFAIGDPFGVGETATMGIVSATGRALGGAIEHYEDFIQTDAAINPGNSGGALIDLHGDLIGINTAIIAGGGGGNEGIGFAIPIDLARNVMDQILQHGKVVRGYLGVTVQAVDPAMAQSFGLPHGGGALIGDVGPNGPAAKAGIERGDIILQMNGQPITGPDDLSVRTSEMAPGTVAHLEVFRNGQMHNIDVSLGEFPENETTAQPAAGAPSAVLKGMDVQNLTAALAQQLHLSPSTQGVVVTNVDPTSDAAAAGIQQGDVIQEVDRHPVHNLNEYQQAAAGMDNKPILLLVNRGGTTYFVVVQPQ